MIRVIELHAMAPAKPAPGQSCNGCGMCCALEPCPVGMLALFQFSGRCRALLWQGNRYACGMVVQPQAHLPWLPVRLLPWASRVAARRIAAGLGCDAEIESDSLPA